MALPRYGAGSLGEVLPSAVAMLTPHRVPRSAEFAEFDNTAALPEGDRVCVLLVDGLGALGLADRKADALVLASLASGTYPGHHVTSGVAVAGFPSTTGASLASLGTGLPPSQHGLVAYRVLIPERGELMSLLAWDKHVDPIVWQPHPTIFERLGALGVDTAHVASPDFAESGLTRAAFRGARYVRSFTPGEIVANTIEELRNDTALVVSYYPDLDKTGHIRGSATPAWRDQLAIVDRLVERLVAQLPPRTTLVITGDHGMVDVPLSGRIDLDADPELLRGVHLLGGEARARHVYAEPGAAADVLAAWRERLAGEAWVVSKEQAIEDNWFGPAMPATVASRLGDVVAAALPHTALVAGVQEAHQSRLIGMHGSLSAMEQSVPLIAVCRD